MTKQVVTRADDVRINAVELRRVGRTFGSTVALRGVDATFDAGRAHLIVGGNGSGKTTLLRIVATMLRPSFGTVRYRGAAGRDVRGAIGWVSHDALVYPDLTGEENLALAAGLYGLSTADAVGGAAKRFGLGAYVRRPVRTMSRGQRQRVALSRALVHRPSLVLLDEPTTGLDGEGIAMLLGVVREEVEAGRLVLVVTHEPAHFATIHHRRWRLVRGRWGEGEGSPDTPIP